MAMLQAFDDEGYVDLNISWQFSDPTNYATSHLLDGITVSFCPLCIVVEKL